MFGIAILSEEYDALLLVVLEVAYQSRLIAIGVFDYVAQNIRFDNRLELHTSRWQVLQPNSALSCV